MSRDGLYNQYIEVKNQMRGLSPKTSLYKRLEVELSKLGDLLGGQGKEVAKRKHKNKNVKINNNETNKKVSC